MRISELLFNFVNNKKMKMPKRIYFESTETTVKNKKCWIDIDTDFTQLYDCFTEVAMKLKSVTTVKLLAWLLSHEAGKNNGISSGRAVYEKYIKYTRERQMPDITERTFQNCFRELTEVEALTWVGKGHYYFNPHVFWRAGKTERHAFITEEAKENKRVSQKPRLLTKTK